MTLPPNCKNYGSIVHIGSRRISINSIAEEPAVQREPRGPKRRRFCHLRLLALLAVKRSTDGAPWGIAKDQKDVGSFQNEAPLQAAFEHRPPV